ncbi:TrkH family potassium uptake protein [Halotalea alkalilenta]|uniref:Trk system potassium uptake protein n=1 Tax=Halotalea alkalilenta TaxID=376489 RepID=A0A172YED0_9GAMM|nr:TrkH family potassium uptake protein [Halotalea alkalilenta]ANF57557.1 potassium transporter TrkH [Halotalea alkalilenta]
MSPFSWLRNLSNPLTHQAGFGPVLRIIAVLLLVLVVMMALPLAVLALERDPDIRAFATSILITLGVSGLLLVLTRDSGFELRPRQMFILTVMSWVVFAGFASLPMMLGSPQLSIADAVFEAVSGVTSTGATVIVDLDTTSDGIKLWRGLLQWIGGVGIIVMAIAILPFLKVGGMRLFQTESSAWTEHIVPRAGGMAKSISMVYLGLSALAMLSYWLLGMRPFDAVVHGMTSVSTGGFANYDESFGIYASRPAILWVTVLFMLSGALPFVLYVRFITQRSMAIWRDQQVRGFFTILLVVIAMMTLERMLHRPGPFWPALTEITFNVVSVITTTGYATSDYNHWGTFAVSVFFYLLFIGGCSGSTTGGMKVFRFQVGLVMLVNQLRHLVHAQGVFVQRYNGRPLTDDIVRAVVAFSSFFFFTVSALSVALSSLGLDMVTSLSASVSMLGNTGPGLGELIGPAGNYAGMPEAAKWLLSFAMLLGRLEILTVLVLLTPAFWRK